MILKIHSADIKPVSGRGAPEISIPVGKVDTIMQDFSNSFPNGRRAVVYANGNRFKTVETYEEVMAQYEGILGV